MKIGTRKPPLLVSVVVYINDKPIGDVIYQQPFGGARASGTNDKTGSK